MLAAVMLGRECPVVVLPNRALCPFIKCVLLPLPSTSITAFVLNKPPFPSFSSSALFVRTGDVK